MDLDISQLMPLIAKVDFEKIQNLPAINNLKVDYSIVDGQLRAVIVADPPSEELYDFMMETLGMLTGQEVEVSKH